MGSKEYEAAYFQNNIQQNKDWNLEELAYEHVKDATSRITSNKIRIETKPVILISKKKSFFQNNIQQNKDWNKYNLHLPFLDSNLPE